MSIYSTNLKIEEIGTGEQQGTWGDTTNKNFVNVFEQAIVGRVTVPFSNADVTLSATNTVNSQDFRNVYLNCTGANAASRNLIVPAINKNYVVENNTTGGFSIVIKTAAGTGVTVPAGVKAAVYVDGTNVVTAFNYYTGTAVFSSITDSGLTATRVTYAGVGGLLTDSANMTFNGTALTLANDASISGLTVGKGGGAVATNTAVGNGALGSNTTGTQNQAFGGVALSSNTTGNYNSAFGYYALGANTTGGANIAMGVTDGVFGNTLASNTTGSYNIAIGNGSLAKNTTGGFNVALGFQSLVQNTTASNNIAVGYQASYSNTTGTENTALGLQSLYSNSTGSYNTAIGSKVLNASTGDQNTAVGAIALTANTGGNNNTVMGVNAGRFNTTGSNNAVLGHSALYSNTVGGTLVAIGKDALYSNTTASNNTAVGYQAGYSNQTGTAVVALGYQAYLNGTASYNHAIGFGAMGTGIVTGQQNIAVGRYSLNVLTSGTNNIAVGDSSLGSNTTGANNTAIGRDALINNTTASNNTAVGYQAAYSNVTGTRVTAYGTQALYSNTGNDSVGVGYQSLYANTTGVGNIAMGYALPANTTGSFNVAIGVSSLQSNTTASNNTAVGYQAGYSNTTGTYNVALGGLSLNLNTTSSQQTALGYGALQNTTGANNTGVGFGAGYLITTGAKNTIIGQYNGNQGGLDIRTASNYIVLSDGDGNPRLVFDGSGNSYLGASAYAQLQSCTNNWYNPGQNFLAWKNTGATKNWYWALSTANQIYFLNNASVGVTMTDGSTSWGAYSDSRLKDVTGAYTNALADIAQIEPVKFTWKSDADKKPCVGVLAQSVQAVVPEAVDFSKLANADEINDQTEYLSVRYTELIPLMIASIQELNAKVEAQALEIATLKAK